ncbi:hypothetical protein D3C75_1208610 [compost metagenome]
MNIPNGDISHAVYRFNPLQRGPGTDIVPYPRKRDHQNAVSLFQNGIIHGNGRKLRINPGEGVHIG